MTHNEVLALMFFVGIMSFCAGVWATGRFSAFVLRRNAYLEDELARERDPADWWKNG